MKDKLISTRIDENGIEWRILQNEKGDVYVEVITPILNDALDALKFRDNKTNKLLSRVEKKKICEKVLGSSNVSIVWRPSLKEMFAIRKAMSKADDYK